MKVPEQGSVRSVHLALTRAAVLEGPVRVLTRRPRELRLATARAQVKLKPLALSPNFCRAWRRAALNPPPELIRGLGSERVPELLVSIYGVGVASVRLRVTLHPNLPFDELAGRWQDLARWAANEMDAAFERLNSLKPDDCVSGELPTQLARSKRFASINVVEGPDLREVSPAVLFKMADPLFPLDTSEEFASSHSILEAGRSIGDLYFLSGSGMVYSLRSGDKPGRKVARRRKVLRRYILTSIDLALALQAATQNPWVADSRHGVLLSLVYLSPRLWSRSRLVWNSPFYGSYGRVARALGLFGAYEDMCKTVSRVLLAEQFSLLAEAMSAARGLGIDLPVESQPVVLTNLEGKVLRVLAMKRALENSGAGVRETVERIAALMGGIPDDRKRRVINSITRRVSRGGLSCGEISSLIDVSERSVSRAVRSLYEKGVVYSEEVKKRGVKRLVRVYVPTEVAEPLVRAWAARLKLRDAKR